MTLHFLRKLGLPLALLAVLLTASACHYWWLDRYAEWGHDMWSHGHMGDWAPYREEELRIPEIHPAKFNVIFLYGGEVNGNGWNMAHMEGQREVESLAGVHAARLENAPAGDQAFEVLWQVLDEGYDAVIATSFGWEEAMFELAPEYPEVHFVNVSGILHNDSNMAALFGAGENARFLAGMAAGARAAADGSRRVGYISSLPEPEMVRLANATVLGMRRTCPDCSMDLRWTHSLGNRELEHDLAHELLDAGATVLVSGGDSYIPLTTASERGHYGVSSNIASSCEVAPEACLGAPYWNWGPSYRAIVESMLDGSFSGGSHYLSFAEGIAGFYGFMEGQTPAAALPPAAVDEIREALSQMLSGEFDRFDIFTGPIRDNQGREVVPAGESLTQSDLEGIDSYLGDQLGRPGCGYCMDWLVEGFVPGAGLSE